MLEMLSVSPPRTVASRRVIERYRYVHDSIAGCRQWSLGLGGVMVGGVTLCWTLLQPAGGKMRIYAPTVTWTLCYPTEITLKPVVI